MIDATEAARALAQRRRGITEIPSERKRAAARANLQKARATWQSTPSAKRKRVNGVDKPA